MREFVREIVAWRDRSREAQERDLGLAWNIEALSRTAKDTRLPALATLLSKQPPKETPKQARSALEMLAKLYGGKLKVRTKKHG